MVAMVTDPPASSEAELEAQGPEAWSWDDEVDPWRLSRVERGRKLSTWETAGATCDELWALRHAVYARHGYVFELQATRDVFAGMSWYRHDDAISRATVGASLTPRDLVNLKRIKKREAKKRCK